MSQMWDERYSAQEYFYGKQPNDYLKEKAKLFTAHSKIICLAEGEGRNAVYLATLGHDVTAVDYSVTGLEKTKELAKENKVEVRCVHADLTDFSLGQCQWDTIVSIWCHLSQKTRETLYGQVVEALKPGGYFLLEAYTPKQIPLKTGGPKDPDLLPTASMLRDELKGINFLDLRELQRHIEEGQGHRGISEVVQVLAQKS